MIIANIPCKSWNMLSTKCVLDLQIFVRGEKTLKQCTMPSMWNIYYSFPRYFYCDISYILGIPQLLWIFSTSGMGFVINNVFVTTFSLICTSRLYITLTEEDTFVEIKSAVRMVTAHWSASCQYLQNKATGDCARICKHDGIAWKKPFFWKVQMWLQNAGKPLTLSE